MSKGAWSAAAESEYSPLRVKRNADGTPIGLVGPDGQAASASAALVAHGVPTLVKDVSGNVIGFFDGVTTRYLSATYTLATRPEAAVYPGMVARLSDVGIGGSFWYSDGVRWRALGRVFLPVTTNDSVGNTNQVVGQALIPAGLIQAGDQIRTRWSALKSGTAQTATLGLYMGNTSGVVGASNLYYNTSVLAAATIRGHAEWGFKRLTATTIKHLSITGSVGLGASTVDTTPDAVFDFDTTPQYLQLCCSFAAGAETVNVREFDVEVLTTGP